MTLHLLVLWMALVGAVRLDLSGGALPVVLSPYLVLTPLVIGALVTRRLMQARPVRIEWSALGYLLLVSLFFTAVGASTFVSVDADATLARGALLVLQFGGATAVALLLHDDEPAVDALRRGAMLGVAVFAVLDVMAVLAFLGVLPEELSLLGATLRLDSYGYAGIIPRLSGAAIDPNNAALLLLVYAYLAPRTRALAVLLLLATLSRSGVLAALAVGAVSAWQFGVAHRRISAVRALAVVAVAVLTLGLAVRSSTLLETAGRMAAPFAERIGLGEGEGSASDHQALIVRAADEGSRSLTRAALGVGWGAAYVVLQDMFPGNRYGNFHSLYGTAFAEAGVVAFVVVLLLFFLPLGRATPWRPAVAGFIVFNMFYQATTEPVFWLLLALAWVVGDRARGASPGVAA
ncbi:MAG: hypothetical protein FJ399_12310 [Verrucomicrobia bacterium]|nr:hypothetical protein [Verrucomicrobiota bacterium]